MFFRIYESHVHNPYLFIHTFNNLIKWKTILKYYLFWSKTYIESDMSSKSIWYQIVKQRGIDQAWCTFIKTIQSQWHLDDVKRVFYDDIFLRLRNINMWFYFPFAEECGILRPLPKWCKLKIRFGYPVLCPAKY